MILAMMAHCLCGFPGTLPSQIVRVWLGNVKSDSSFSLLSFFPPTSKYGVKGLQKNDCEIIKINTWNLERKIVYSLLYLLEYFFVSNGTNDSDAYIFFFNIFCRLATWPPPWLAVRSKITLLAMMIRPLKKYASVC